MMARWAYIGVVRPMLTYGTVVWAQATKDNKTCANLRKLNRLALMTLGHFPQSTPTAGLEIITGVPPLPLYIP